jgi:hypothetical protein
MPVLARVIAVYAAFSRDDVAAAMRAPSVRGNRDSSVDRLFRAVSVHLAQLLAYRVNTMVLVNDDLTAY